MTTPTDAELLPCPFCGKAHTLIVGAASEMWDEDDHGPFPHTETYAVFCDASSEGGKGGCGGSGGYFVTKEDAIAAWNSRPPQAGAGGEPVATVIKKGADRQWMSERMGSLPDGIYSLYTATPPQAVREPQPMPDLTQLTERGAEAWAGVDAQALRVWRKPLTDEQIAEGFANRSRSCGLFAGGARFAEQHHGITKGGQHGAP